MKNVLTNVMKNSEKKTGKVWNGVKKIVITGVENVNTFVKMVMDVIQMITITKGNQ